MKKKIELYTKQLIHAMSLVELDHIEALGESLFEAWCEGRRIYLCGNGGSAGNAVHLANDWIYGAGTTPGGGLRVESLSANTAVITCLGNDIGYDEIYAEQIRVKAESGDILIVLSGSGNSPNVVSALEVGNAIGMKTFAILGYTGGRCKEIAQHPIHFKINDMQIAEDLQLVVGHICMQWLREKGKA
jgi:D-sedoheptulose 7-phosphate isomerase